MNQSRPETALPSPLPANSRLLANRRYHVFVLAENETGAYKAVAEARFARESDARKWADAAYPEAEIVDICSNSRLDGWRPRHVDRRLVAGWGFNGNNERRP